MQGISITLSKLHPFTYYYDPLYRGAALRAGLCRIEDASTKFLRIVLSLLLCCIYGIYGIYGTEPGGEGE
jgi:hypothetical protein